VTNVSLAQSYLTKARVRLAILTVRYGDIDFIPTEQYDAPVAMRAIEGARECVAAATRVIVV